MIIVIVIVIIIIIIFIITMVIIIIIIITVIIIIMICQVSFRQLLTMLSVFDCVFIATVSVSFSLPQLSSYWKVIIVILIVIIVTIIIVIVIVMVIIVIVKKASNFVSLSGVGSPACLPLGFPFHTNRADRLHVVKIHFAKFYQKKKKKIQNFLIKLIEHRSTVSVTCERFLSVVYPRHW